MSIANPLWGACGHTQPHKLAAGMSQDQKSIQQPKRAPRIHGELLKVGIDVGQTTVAKYMASSADNLGLEELVRSGLGIVLPMLECSHVRVRATDWERLRITMRSLSRWVYLSCSEEF
jgi:hypothetical protein